MSAQGGCGLNMRVHWSETSKLGLSSQPCIYAKRATTNQQEKWYILADLGGLARQKDGQLRYG